MDLRIQPPNSRRVRAAQNQAPQGRSQRVNIEQGLAEKMRIFKRDQDPVSQAFCPGGSLRPENPLDELRQLFRDLKKLEARAEMSDSQPVAGPQRFIARPQALEQLLLMNRLQLLPVDFQQLAASDRPPRHVHRYFIPQ